MTSTPRLTLRTRTAYEPEPDLTSVVVIHRAVRQDLRRLAACLSPATAAGMPPSRARAICGYTAALLAEIGAHLGHEEEIVWPVIAVTAGQAVDLAPLADDHRAIEAAADRAGRALACFRADPGALAGLHASADGLRDMLNEHITDEEQQVFPAMRRYLPAEAYRWCEQQIWREASLPRLRFTAPWLARHAQPGELSRLLAVGGWPARIVLAAARPAYQRLERQAFGAGPPAIRSSTNVRHDEEEER